MIHAFNAKGPVALDPRWAGGRPRLISDEDVEFIVAAATTRPEKLGQPFTHWSLRKLVKKKPARLPATPDILAAQRRERAHIRSERQQRWGRPKIKAA